MNTFKKRSAADAASAHILPDPKRPRLSPTRDADARVPNQIIEYVDGNKESPAVDHNNASLTGFANNQDQAEVLAQLYGKNKIFGNIQNDVYCSPEVVNTAALLRKIATLHPRLTATHVVPAPLRSVEEKIDSNRFTVMYDAHTWKKKALHKVAVFACIGNILSYELRIDPRQVCTFRGLGPARPLNSNEPLNVEITFTIQPSGAKVTGFFNLQTFYSWDYLNNLNIRTVSAATIIGKDFTRKQPQVAMAAYATYHNARFSTIVKGRTADIPRSSVPSPNCIADAHQSSFLSLPAEIREQIYECVFLSPNPYGSIKNETITLVLSGTVAAPRSSGILRTCLVIYHEALPYLYRSVHLHVNLTPLEPKTSHLYRPLYCNNFIATETEHPVFFAGYGPALAFLSRLSPCALACIRYLTLTFQDQFTATSLYEKEDTLRHTQDPVIQKILDILGSQHGADDPYELLEVFCKGSRRMVDAKRDAAFVHSLTRLKAQKLHLPYNKPWLLTNRITKGAKAILQNEMIVARPVDRPILKQKIKMCYDHIV